MEGWKVGRMRLNAEAFTRWKVGALERLAGASGEYRVKSGYGCRDHRTPQAHHRKNPGQAGRGVPVGI
jgi:hypothetical protein